MRMADNDSQRDSRRNSHYDQQRSSLRSDRSRTTTRDGRTASTGGALDEIADPDSFTYLDEVAAPSPVDDRRNQRSGLEGMREKATSTGSRGREVDKRRAPDVLQNLDEIAAPSPIQDGRDQRVGLEDQLKEPRQGSRGADVRATGSHKIPAAAAVEPQKEPDPRREYLASKGSAGRQRRSRFATELYTVSFLVLFSILGTLARLGLQRLTFYPGAPVVFSVLWPNFAGSLLMGFLSEDQQLFRHEWGRSISATYYKRNDEEKATAPVPLRKAVHAKVKKTIPLYIGFTTGFCGSFTSFSTFMADIFFALSNDLSSPIDHPYPSPTPSITSTVPRNGGYSFMAVCAVILITVGLCYSALNVGAHMAFYTSGITPTLPFHFFRRFIDPILVFIAWGVWLGAVFMAIWPPDHPGGPQSKGSWGHETWRGQAIFACVFAPLGCLLRFYVSLKLNGIVPSFPLGTFTVNMFGTAVLGMAYDLQHVTVDGAGVGGGLVGCQVLQGLMDGFCGSLTTVSTWILEIDALRRGHSYVYGSVSVLAGLATMVVIMGSVRWSVGWTEIACVT